MLEKYFLNPKNSRTDDGFLIDLIQALPQNFPLHWGQGSFFYDTVSNYSFPKPPH